MLSQAMEVPRAKLNGKETLSELDTWDSLAVVNFMALVDTNCGIAISPERLLGCESIADIEALIRDCARHGNESVHQLH